MRIINAPNEIGNEITALLRSENLPWEDLPAVLNNFFVATDGDRVVGAIGLEIYDNCGLLRSMVVDKQFRNKSIATALVNKLESQAAVSGIDCIYLFTETADGYFARKGYEKIMRDEVPDAMKASSEFRGVCPASAIIMKKSITEYEYNRRVNSSVEGG